MSSDAVNAKQSHCMIQCRKRAASRRRDIMMMNRPANYGEHGWQDDVFGTSSLLEMFVAVVCVAVLNELSSEMSRTEHHVLCHLECK